MYEHSRHRRRSRDADHPDHYGTRDMDDYEPRYTRREYSGNPYNRRDCKPITSHVGAGRRARIAVETGGPNATALDEVRKEQWEEMQAERNRARVEAKLEVTRREVRHRPPPPVTLRSSARRHDNAPIPDPDDYTHYGAPVDTKADDGLLAEPLPAEPVDERPASEGSFSIISGDGDDYDFKLPVKPVAATYDFVEEVSFPLDADSNEGSRKPSQPSRSKFSGPITKESIAQSRWLGSAYDRGDLSADISTPGTGSSQLEKNQDPLMTWYHLERSTMSFEEFIAAAQSTLQVSEQKRRDVNKLLRDVQRKFEKQRQHGRDLEPNCVSDLFVGDSSSKESACVMFLAFPYFALEPYNVAQFKNLTPGTPMHPLRPLLQAHFHSTSQRRELAQAITKSPNTGHGNCLHLSEVWCLIIDGDTMITCSRQSHDALCDPAIIKSHASTSDETTRIRVSFGNDRSWQVPVDEDTTWPAFLSVFGESIASLEVDGAVPDFKVNGSSVNTDEWPFLVRAAQSGSIGIDLHQKMLKSGGGMGMTSAIPQLSVETSGSADTATADSSAQGQEGTDPQETINVDDMAAGSEDGSLAIFQHSDSGLEFLANDLHEVLQSNKREKEKKAYDRGTETKPFAIARWMQAKSNSSQDSKLGLIGPAFYLFRFFWPCTFSHPLTDKYWGAIERILQQDSQTYSTADVDSALADLTNAIPVMQSLTHEFSASPNDLSPLPDSYAKAFLHLLMVFILLSQTSPRRTFGVSNSTVRAHIKGLKDELGAGKRAITARLKTQTQIPNLEELEICSHTSLLALVLNQFSQDVMHGKPDVASTYNDFFYQLDFRITEDPTPRSHQVSLRFFLQEVEAILSMLQYQLSVIEAFEQSLQQQRQSSDGLGDDNFFLRYALGESRQQIVLDDCKARISARIDKFRGLQQRAEDLGEWHRNEMETNRDRQENAIMVFTIVTIVFLPLSFVSSVFGMNTSDVRDMPYSQWAYWAAGLPLTVLVVVGSLWWAGEFEGFWRWVQGNLSRGTSASVGYQRIPEPVSYGNRKLDRGEMDVQLAAPRVGASHEPYPPPVATRRTTYPRRKYK